MAPVRERAVTRLLIIFSWSLATPSDAVKLTESSVDGSVVSKPSCARGSPVSAAANGFSSGCWSDENDTFLEWQWKLRSRRLGHDIIQDWEDETAEMSTICYEKMYLEHVGGCWTRFMSKMSIFLEAKQNFIVVSKTTSNVANLEKNMLQLCFGLLAFFSEQWAQKKVWEAYFQCNTQCLTKEYLYRAFQQLSKTLVFQHSLQA